MEQEKIEEMRFLKYPMRMRNQTVFSGEFLPSAKLVYTFILYMQEYNEDFSPSSKFMERRFGISQPTFSKSVVALEKFGYVEIVKNTNCRTKNTIKIIWDKIDSTMFSMIPNCIINTDVYTNDQKLFLILLCNINKATYGGHIFTSRSVLSIYKSMKGMGIGENSVYARIKELSDPNSGFINCLEIIDGSVYINTDVLLLISERCVSAFEYSIQSKIKYPVYTKPKKGDFYIDLEAKKIRKRKNGSN